jgi:hypothetical protein
MRFLTPLFCGSALLVLLLPSTTAFAQTPATTFSDVPGLVATGRRVVVTDENGRKTKGDVVQVTPSSITLRTRDRWGEEQRRVFEAESVRAINKTDSVWNGLLIGLGAGFAATEVFVWQSCGPRGNDDECAAIVTGVGWLTMVPGGAAIGALADRAIGNGALYYKPERTRTPLSISPMIGPKAGGALVSVRF